jgi:hypothetical protein
MREFRIAQISHFGVRCLLEWDNKYALARSGQLRFGVKNVAEKAMDSRKSSVTRAYCIAALRFEHREKVQHAVWRYIVDVQALRGTSVFVSRKSKQHLKRIAIGCGCMRAHVALVWKMSNLEFRLI